MTTAQSHPCHGFALRCELTLAMFCYIGVSAIPRWKFGIPPPPIPTDPSLLLFVHCCSDNQLRTSNRKLESLEQQPSYVHCCNDIQLCTFNCKLQSLKWN